MVAREETGEILGGLVTARRITEVIGGIAPAMRPRLTVAQLAETIGAHPKSSESVRQAANRWLGPPSHTLP